MQDDFFGIYEDTNQPKKTVRNKIVNILENIAGFFIRTFLFKSKWKDEVLDEVKEIKDYEQ